MEALQALAQAEFNDKRCVGSNSDFETIEILTFDGQPTTYHKQTLSDEQLTRYVTQPISPSKKADKVTASLQLVRVSRYDNEDLCVSAKTFHTIFKCFELDPNILHLISNNSYGFHRFQIMKKVSDDAKFAHCFFISTIIYGLIWSFNPKTLTTKVLLINRVNNGLTSGREAYHTFDAILNLYKNHIYSPCLLMIVAAVQTTRFLDKLVLDQLYLLRKVEAYTGHGAYVYHGPKSSDPESILKDISRWSTEVGSCLIGCANQQRHANIVTSLIVFINEIKINGDPLRADIDKGLLLKYDKTMANLQTAIPVLKDQLRSTQEYISYLTERAKNQSTVLFGLLTHQDALIGTNLASSSKEIAEAAKKDGEAMKELAAATKRDGEAMKTIAIMTMMFLPATFFAALFAIPSLQWDKKPVIQDSFAVYWAFTLPTTIIVFLIWFIMTNWKSLQNRAAMWMERWSMMTVDSKAESGGLDSGA